MIIHLPDRSARHPRRLNWSRRLSSVPFKMWTELLMRRRRGLPQWHLAPTHPLLQGTIKFHRCLQRKTDVMTYWKPRDSETLKFAIKLYRVYLLIRICHEVLNELNSFWLHLLFSGWVDDKHSKSRPGETLG